MRNEECNSVSEVGDASENVNIEGSGGGGNTIPAAPLRDSMPGQPELEQTTVTAATVPIATTRKVYLQSQPSLTQHVIWRKVGFWETALLEGVLAQLRLRGSASQWDELSTDALREEVIGKEGGL